MPRPAFRLAILAAVATLAGCANFTEVAPGSMLTDVEASFGRHNHECPLPDGGKRVIWATQPHGQYAWATNVSPTGQIDKIVPILTDEYFKKLHVGMTPDELLCTYGPPALIEPTGLGEMRRTVWSYRYRQSGVWNSLMHVYINDNDQVDRFHPGPDPMFDEDRFFW